MKNISPIIAFAIASAGIHIGLILISNDAVNITLPGTNGSVIAVKIEETSFKSVPQKLTHEIRQQKIIPAKNKNIALEKNSKNETLTKNINELSSTSVKNHSAKSKARVISVIYKELNQYFVYPKLAQRRNWQGKVLLSLRVTSTGKIDNVKVNKSSGYSILDKAAIQSLLKVESLPQISYWLSSDIHLQLPVVYQLTEG